MKIKKFGKVIITEDNIEITEFHVNYGDEVGGGTAWASDFIISWAIDRLEEEIRSGQVKYGGVDLPRLEKYIKSLERRHKIERLIGAALLLFMLISFLAAIIKC